MMDAMNINNQADSFFYNIPDELKSYAQWVAFRFGPRKENGKLDKIPINPSDGAAASVSAPATWATFSEAVRASRSRDGIGFVFTATDPYCGIDLDGCRDPQTGQLADWAWEIVQRLDSYTEASPSGTGVHVICKAKFPGGGGKRGQVEMYEAGRFFTMTGEHVGGTRPTIEDRQGAVAALYNEHFQREERTQAKDHKQSTLSAAEIERIRSALCCISAADYEVWLRVGMALHNADSSRGFSLWRDWYATSPEKLRKPTVTKGGEVSSAKA
jgi:primase-polymerase (primpol)-like protein